MPEAPRIRFRAAVRDPLTSPAFAFGCGAASSASALGFGGTRGAFGFGAASSVFVGPGSGLLDVRLRDADRELPHAQDVSGPLGHADAVACVEHVEDVRALEAVL